MLIDTHCHLDAAEFAVDQAAVISQAQALGVQQIVVPAVERANFAVVRDLAAHHFGLHYALGIHPMYVAQALESDLQALRDAINSALNDSHFVGIGEIGLDYFVPELTQNPLKEKQEYFYAEQVRIATEFGLPVILHVRRSQDQVLKQLRRFRPVGGIAHAFNGSVQQAEAYLALGFKLGFGGAMTFTRALQIRRLAAELPLDALVLETDAPDIAPSWLMNEATADNPTSQPISKPRNTPAELPRIAQVLAELRGVTVATIATQTCANALAVLPRLALSGITH
ncbi:TatD family hydrolase [Ampullimonas aquatilis]|uniref:TatD family hydrolase n=1 Tax=Ampullimonas aquatilis TaxID=1341549 RepID=UPI003C728DCA